MGAVWEPEEVVSPALARELVERAFPALAPATVELLGEGWDNTVYRINDGWVFRFPRRQIAVQLLENECALLPRLASELSLRIPEPEHIGPPSEAFQWLFAGYRMVAGRAALGLDDEARRRTAEPLARFLSELHRFPEATALERSVPRDEFRRLDIEHRTPMIEERLAQAVASELISKRLVRLSDAVLSGVPGGWRPETRTLVHGDLYSLHLLVDESSRPVGVIDWGDVHLGDAAIDLAMAHLLLPAAARETFRDAYFRPVSDATWAAARYRALLSCLTTLVYSADIGNEPLLRESQAALGFVLED